MTTCVEAGTLPALARGRDHALIDATATTAYPDDAREALLTTTEAFFRFVDEHPTAWRMLFRDVPGDPQIAEEHRAMQRRGSRTRRSLTAGPPSTRPQKRAPTF
jgi:hypothetical protein